jgi:hypothetical protein
MNESKDWVDQAVREVWFKTPGIGVKVMLQQILEKCKGRCSLVNLQNHDGDGDDDVATSSLLPHLGAIPDPSTISKARVKHSQAWIPYRQLPNESITLSESQQIFVETKVRERVAFRVTRQFDRSDRIQHALEAMGVELDDRLKTWRMVKEPPSHDFLNEENLEDPGAEALPSLVSLNITETSQSSISSSNSTCKFCQKVFPSRNHVFRHLRDETSGCGTAIFASGQEIEEPPSVIEARRRREELRARRGNKGFKGQAARHVEAENCLWFGDLPLPWTSPRKQFSLLRSILFHYVPRDVPTPWIKRVVRKGYRKNSGGVYHGYAILVFRDTVEAQKILQCLDGQAVDPDQCLQRQVKEKGNVDDLGSFVLKVRAAENPDRMAAIWNDTNDELSQVAGEDPPLIDQLRPLELDEIRRRISSFISRQGNTRKIEEGHDEGTSKEGTSKEGTSKDTSADDNAAEELLSRLVEHYSLEEGSRVFVKRQGRTIPLEIRDKILEILESLRWPARNERPGLASERYLVLHTNVSSDRFYGDLRDACRELMDWADPDYFYSGVAVTKNFVASPHIDHRDTSVQYAVSLGNFGPGGELCVEGVDCSGQEIVNVVSTHDRIARVDGRHVHYVRTWEGGDRYSLIFYDTSEGNTTPVLELGVDEVFTEDDDQ